jgi:hypothetical protein
MWWGIARATAEARSPTHPYDGDHAEQQHEGEEELKGAVPDQGPQRNQVPLLSGGDPLGRVLLLHRYPTLIGRAGTPTDR